MGVYFGSKYIAVNSDNLQECYIEQVDLKPNPESSRFNETYFLPIPDKLKQHSVFDDIKTARETVKKHIFKKTENLIVEHTVAIELSKLDIEELRTFKYYDDWRLRINTLKEDIKLMSKKLKTLKKMRRRPVAESQYQLNIINETLEGFDVN